MKKITLIFSLLTALNTYANDVSTYVKDIECTGRSKNAPFPKSEKIALKMTTYKMNQYAKNHTLRVSFKKGSLNEEIHPPIHGEQEGQVWYLGALRRLNNQVISFDENFDIKLTIYENINGVQKLYGKLYESDFSTHHYDLNCTAIDYI